LNRGAESRGKIAGNRKAETSILGLVLRLPRFVDELLHILHLLGELFFQSLRLLALGIEIPLAVYRSQPFLLFHVARSQRALEHLLGIVGQLLEICCQPPCCVGH
jgi:hypothetical protein